jgi:hypothetical protein
MLHSRYLNILGSNAKTSISERILIGLNVHVSCIISKRNVIIDASLPLIEITTVGITFRFLIVKAIDL